jgi:hypothetical protein
MSTGLCAQRKNLLRRRSGGEHAQVCEGLSTLVMLVPYIMSHTDAAYCVRFVKLRYKVKRLDMPRCTGVPFTTSSRLALDT